jgi:hypothetical protein
MSLPASDPHRGRQLFLSYSSTDKDAVLRLRTGLERMGQQVWADVEMMVGTVWWSEICDKIRSCDALIVATSPKLVNSEASRLERKYARSLGKPILPVLVQPVRPELLPADLTRVQFVDYCDPTPEAAFELAAALSRLPPTPPLPEPLPPEPPVPGNYWFAIAEEVHAPSLTLDQQMSLVARLRYDLRKPGNTELVAELLQALSERRDLYAATSREIEDLQAQSAKNGPSSTGDGRSDRTTPAPESPTPPASSANRGGPAASASTRPPPPTLPGAQHGAGHPTAVPGNRAAPSQQNVYSRYVGSAPRPGWYPDPARRHRLRWFDRTWTSWVFDNGPVFRDPL